MRTVIPSFVGFARAPWEKGRLIGQKRPPRPKEVWAIRVRLQLEQRRRDLALFNLAIDSKLRGGDLVRLRVSDVCVGDRTNPSSNPQFTGQYRSSKRPILLPELLHGQPHISTRQYARIVHRWVERAGFASSAYGTHSLRTLIQHKCGLWRGRYQFI
jgi:hypothetical protein